MRKRTPPPSGLNAPWTPRDASDAVGKRGGGGIDLGVVRGMMKTARDVGKTLIAVVDGFLLAAESGAGEGEDDDDAMET